jgi:ABC-type transport system involved in multi-copper enzyme maturation permease subunit
VCDIGDRAKSERREMDDSLMVILAAASQIPQRTVQALIIVAGLFVLGLLILLGMFIWKVDEPMKYGNFFVVALGITTALMGFLVAFPLLISGVFKDPTQVLAILSALFGAIVGLVGTFFGVKASSDAGERAQEKASQATDQAAQTIRAVTPGHAGEGQQAGGG